MKIKYDGKLPYYDVLPIGWKTATIEDFYQNEKLILDTPYLIHSEVDPSKYWACRVKVSFLQENDFDLFLAKGRVYVLN